MVRNNSISPFQSVSSFGKFSIFCCAHHGKIYIFGSHCKRTPTMEQKSAQATIAAEEAWSLQPDDIWPYFQPSEDEAEILQSLQPTLTKYVKQSRVKFITGEWNLTADWESYVEELNNLGLSGYLAVRGRQYERYRRIGDF